MDTLTFEEKKDEKICNICFMAVDDFVKAFSCQHEMCKFCVVDYCKSKINNGEIRSMTCTQVGCKSEIQIHQMKELVPEDLFQKFDRLSLSKAIDRMRDVSYCPKCNTVVLVDDRGHNYGRCSSCDNCFCVLCKKNWHSGECYPKWRKVGSFKSNFEYSIYEEIKNDLKMLDLTRRCPSCLVFIEKNGGCNHMKCFSCGLDFMWTKAIIFEEVAQQLREEEQRKAKEARLQAMEEEIERRKIREKKKEERLYDLEYKKENSTECPGCLTLVSKASSSNHLRCKKCKTQFCFSCGARAKSTSHFSLPNKCKQHTSDEEDKIQKQLIKKVDIKKEVQTLKLKSKMCDVYQRDYYMHEDEKELLEDENDGDLSMKFFPTY